MPGVSHVTNWPYQVVGAGFGLLGIAFIVVGFLRARAVDRAVERGEFPRLDEWLELALIAAGAALGIGTVLLVVLQT